MLGCNFLPIWRKISKASLTDYRTKNFTSITIISWQPDKIYGLIVFSLKIQHTRIYSTTVIIIKLIYVLSKSIIDFQRNRNKNKRYTCAIVRVHLFVRIKSFYTIKHKALDTAYTKPITVLVQFRYFGFTLVKSHYNALKHKQSKYHRVK